MTNVWHYPLSAWRMLARLNSLATRATLAGLGPLGRDGGASRATMREAVLAWSILWGMCGGMLGACVATGKAHDASRVLDSGGAPPDPALDCSELIQIPAGEAALGSDAAEKAFGYSIGGAGAQRARWFDVEQQRTVNLPAFWIEATLVTQQQYGEFVRATGHRVPYISEADYQRQGYLVHPYDSVAPYLWFGDHPPMERKEHPVVLISAEDAHAYCIWHGQRSGTACGLPTEDQWEKAARGTKGQYFPWGDEWDPTRLNTAARGPYGTTAVTHYPQGRSPYGLYDMAGNVFEWTATPGRRGRTVVKSCSWDDLGGICRSASRHERATVARHILIGFRCACDGPARDGPD